MKVDELVRVLSETPARIHLMLPDASFVPAHFHVTEVGRVQKDFIDCGGTGRSTTSCVLQVWVADDIDHRLDTRKLDSIIRLAAARLKIGDLPVEIEYESGTVSQYPLTAAEVTPGGLLLHLGTKQTACLAPDRCGVGSAEVGSGSMPGCC
jgi:hypothetical protein